MNQEPKFKEGDLVESSSYVGTLKVLTIELPWTTNGEIWYLCVDPERDTNFDEYTESSLSLLTKHED